jgi:hypothetical protein
MIDEIFKVRFVEEVASLSKLKDKKARLRMHFFAVLSFFLAFGSSVASLELIIDAVRQPEKRYFINFIVTFILLGFTITFWLTFVIFVIAYARNAAIRRCFLNLSCAADKKELSPGDEITVDIRFGLVKKAVSRVRLELVCQKETILKVLDISSVKKEKPYKKESIVDEILSEDKSKIIWGITIYFDFFKWYSYEKDIPLNVI